MPKMCITKFPNTSCIFADGNVCFSILLHILRHPTLHLTLYQVYMRKYLLLCVALMASVSVFSQDFSNKGKDFYEYINTIKNLFIGFDDLENNSLLVITRCDATKLEKMAKFSKRKSGVDIAKFPNPHYTLNIKKFFQFIFWGKLKNLF